MSVIEKYVKMGINSSMLFPASFEDGCAHLHGINTVCRMPQYEVIETFLSDNDEIRRMQTRVILDSGLTFNYHCPLPLQQDGGKNPCSDDLEIRKAALAYAKKHVDYAAEAGSALMVVVSPPDKGSERRVEQKKLFIEYYAQLAEYALGRGIDACLEPVERNRFKKLLLGPTSECVEFIMTMQS